jgi:hypothetical protein
MAVNYFDMKKANDMVNNACGQLLTVPNGAYNIMENETIVIDEIGLGSVWLAKSAKGKTYAVSASHCLDNYDAYLNSYNIIGKHSNESTNGEYIIKSLKNQTHLYLMSSSPNIFIEVYITNSSHDVVFALSDNFTSLVHADEIDVNSARDNILNVMFGLPANYYNPETETNASNYRVEWSPIDETGFLTGVNISDTANNQFCIGKIDLTTILDAKYIEYRYGNNTDGGQFMLVTSGEKEKRWIQNIYSDFENVYCPTRIFNYGLIMATFPNSALKNKPVQLQVVGGDHRSDIVIMYPNFAGVDMGIDEDEWNKLIGLYIDNIENVFTGAVIGTVGNPEFVAQSSFNGGFVRNPKSAETSYCPSDPILTTLVPLHGMSGSPMFAVNGKVTGLFTYGIGSLTANISGGPNANILGKVFKYVTDSFELSSTFDQVDMVKNYIGADFYNFSVDYVDNLLNVFSYRYDVKGLVVDSIDEFGPFGNALAVGDILISISYAKRNKPSETVTVILGNGKTEQNIFSIIYNTDIHLGKINITYMSGTTYDIATVSNISLGTYSSNIHADYYFGDTTYKLKKNVAESKNTLNTQYTNRTERVNDTYVNKLSLRTNKSYKLNVKRLVQAFKVNDKAREKFREMVNKKNKKIVKKTK